MSTTTKPLLVFKVTECSTPGYLSDVVCAFSLSEAKRKFLERWGLKRFPKGTVIQEYCSYGMPTQVSS